jgi:NADH-quinone oxidoreductase subunit J
MTVFFYIAAIIAILSTVLVVTRANVVHALIYMVISLLATAVMFFIVGAPFMAALEIMIYAGAIMVLFVFVIMMLNLGTKGIEQEKEWLSASGWVIPALFSFVLLVEIIYLIVASPVSPLAGKMVPPKEVGYSLFTTYLIGVELAAVLLLAGIVGAYHLARKKKHVVHRFLQSKGVDE